MYLYCLAVSIPAGATGGDRFKLIIYFTGLVDPAAMYSQVVIEGNVGNVPIVSEGAGWWYCDFSPAPEATCTSGFEAITTLSDNTAPS